MREKPYTTLSIKEKKEWLRLLRSENVGPITFYRLLERFGSARAALSALPGLARRGGRSKAIKIASPTMIEKEVEALDKLGVDIIAWREPDYPPLLAHVEDAPPLLFVLGHRHLLSKKSIAVVGARNASINGKNFARRISDDLGKGGFLVTSGMARGIDTEAHTGALETGTVAVLAGGVDIIYPKENKDLYREIIERGAVISEIQAGTQPQARHFPRRNRIISGMARGVVVIEAGQRSGSLITARMALEQGREVFAVPGSPVDPRSRGGNALIRSGAILIETAENVFDVLNSSFGNQLEEQEAFDFSKPLAPEPSQNDLETARPLVEESLGTEPVTVDEIIRICQLSHPVVSTVLLELELAGRLERHPGQKVSIVLS